MEKPQKTPKNKLDAAYRELKYLNKVSSQTDFGDKLDYSKSYFSQLMNNAEPITDILIDKCFDVFGIPKQWWDESLDTPLVIPDSKRTGDTKSPQSIGKVGKWMHDMRNEFYKKVYDKKYPKTAIEIEIEMLREELDNMEELLRKEKEGQ